MKIAIFSMMAAIVGSSTNTSMWQGEVSPELLGYTRAELAWRRHDGIDEVNERIFRLFNRIEEGDNERLVELGYFLPSLSVGDFVSWGCKTYAVAMMGFQTVTGNENEAARFIMESHGFDKG